ncbi:MAG TPA: hypothetical protein VGI19_04695 [Candidatus Cybelea sp.]
MGRTLSLGLCFGIALLAGCSGPQQGVTPAGLVTSAAASRVRWPATSLLARPDARHSWMNAEAKRRDLLYVADDLTNDVYVFSYPQGKLVGTLTGFAAPGGLCTDSHGDVFIPNAFYSNIVEYSHGGTMPIATLNDAPASYPDSCAVNQRNGDLAVGNGASGDGQGRGGIAIYHGAAGEPSFRHAMYHPYSCGYDPNGNLFVDGEKAGYVDFQFGELAAGGMRYREIALNQPISLAGGVAWDGRAVAVGDVYRAAIYQFSVAGARGKRVGSTPLTGTAAAWQFEVDGGRVVVPNYDSGASEILSYDYPAGGAAIKAFGAGIVVDPVGATISRAH